MAKTLLTGVMVLIFAAVANAQSAPRILPGKRVIKNLPRQHAFMECLATGDPAPSITWERDGVPVQRLATRFSVNKKSRALRVFKLEFEDQGNYTCIAKNYLGLDSVIFSLYVLVEPKARITSPPNYTFIELTNEELVCRSRGIPAPMFEWHTSQHQMIRNSQTPREERFSTQVRQIDDEVYESVLQIRPVTYKDFGVFTCIATNEVASSRDKVDLDVRFSPKVISLYNSSLPVYWWEDHNTNLICVVSGNDLPILVWTRNGEPFDCKEETFMGNGVEVSSICNIKDTNHGGPGNYSCKASNSLGEIVAHEFFVTEIYAPPPVEFYPISMRLHEIDLMIHVPTRENTPPSIYVVASYKLAFPSANDQFDNEYERTQDLNEHGQAIVTLPGIRENNNYTVSVRAKNMVGLGPATTVILSPEMLSSSTIPVVNNVVTTSEYNAEQSDIGKNDNSYVRKDVRVSLDDEMNRTALHGKVQHVLDGSNAAHSVMLGGNTGFSVHRNDNIICRFGVIILSLLCFLKFLMSC